jgi:hypothetical protein
MYEGIARWPCFVHHAKPIGRAFIPCREWKIFFNKPGIKFANSRRLLSAGKKKKHLQETLKRFAAQLHNLKEASAAQFVGSNAGALTVL